MITLGIESSCDDTAAALLRGDTIISSVVASQDMVHERFGGVVPELASRRHLESITTVVDEALARAGCAFADLGLISVTRGPGLIGALLVGFCYAKALAVALKIPWVGVDHMAGHLLSPFLEPDRPRFPYIALIVSGGTTALFEVSGFLEHTLLGATRDDAAGEAFDKIARHLGLGYPGGPAIARAAAGGDPEAFRLPRAWLGGESLDFSFSGLKTAVIAHCDAMNGPAAATNRRVADLCASFEQAVIDVLIGKLCRAAEQRRVDTVVLGGGVAANRSLRTVLEQRCRECGLALYLPAPPRCTDNAAMIAYAGWKQFEAGDSGHLDDDVYSRSSLGR